MNNPTAEFKIWGADGNVYGPLDLPTLIACVKDERVAAHTWIYRCDNDVWQKAAVLQELNLFFAKPAGKPAESGLRPGMLRRVKVLADLSEAQLERFAGFMEVIIVRQWAHLVRQGSPGAAMYLILEGELRVRIMVGDKETILATLAPGECFGEMSLFDDSPRSADVISNADCTLLKISVETFARLMSDAPELAAPFLLALCKTLAGRIRADNKRVKDAVNFSRVGGY